MWVEFHENTLQMHCNFSNDLSGEVNRETALFKTKRSKHKVGNIEQNVRMHLNIYIF